MRVSLRTWGVRWTTLFWVSVGLMLILTLILSDPVEPGRQRPRGCKRMAELQTGRTVLVFFPSRYCRE